MSAQNCLLFRCYIFIISNKFFSHSTNRTTVTKYSLDTIYFYYRLPFPLIERYYINTNCYIFPLSFKRFTICTIYSKEDCLLFFASAEEFSSPFAWKFEEELLSLLTKSDGRVERPAAASSEVSMRSWPSSRSACLFNSSNCRSPAYLQPF